MRFFPKAFCGIALICASNYTAAIQTDFASQCDANLRSEITFDYEYLTVTSKNSDVVKFDKNGNTWVNDNALSLSIEQQGTAKAYYEKVETILPQVLEVASGALQITQEALIQTFSELFGENSEFVRDLDNALSELQKELRSSFEDDQGRLAVSPGMLARDGQFAADVEQKVDNLFTDFIGRATGEMVSLIAKSMMNGGGNAQEMQEKFSNFEKDLESKIETQVTELEAYAKELCQSFEELDRLENELNKTTPLKDLDMVRFKQKT